MDVPTYGQSLLFMVSICVTSIYHDLNANLQQEGSDSSLQGTHTMSKAEYTWLPLSCPQDQQESSDSSLQGTHTVSKAEHTRLPLSCPQATMWVTAEQSRPAATRHLSQSAGDGAPHSLLNSQTKQVVELPPCD